MTLEETAPIETRKVILKEWSVLFDKMFFYSTVLRLTGPVLFPATLDLDLCPAPEEEGAPASMFDPNAKKISIHIISYPNLASERKDYPPEVSDRLWPNTFTDWIVVVLKEVLQAFFYFYYDSKRPASRGGEGTMDHGPAWADCTVILEEWLQGAVKWKVATDIWPPIGQSMTVDGWQATREQTIRWGIVRFDLDNGKSVWCSKLQVARCREEIETHPDYLGVDIKRVTGI
jgi:hypothetical protein